MVPDLFYPLPSSQNILSNDFAELFLGCTAVKVSRWSWDFRTFVADAKISAYQDQQRVGNVEFKAPNSGNLSKFGDDIERIKAMMDILFDKKTAAQATQLITDDKL